MKVDKECQTRSVSMQMETQSVNVSVSGVSNRLLALLRARPC